MITFRYGRAYLQLAKTQAMDFLQERDPSYTDAMYTVYDIKIKGFLANSEGIFPGLGSNLSHVELLNLLKQELSTPRLSMEYRIGQTVVVSTTGLDAAKGPDPYKVSVTSVSGGVFFVEIGCRVSVVDCTNECKGGRSPILSLRWTQTESFDENWYSNLTTEGHLIVRSDMLQSADNFRPLATPPILVDYKRKVSKYTLAPDGLTLDFHFEDQEYDRLPPYPATKASGTYTVSIERPGTKRIGTVRIHLEGQKGTDRKALFIRACGMAYSKLENDQLFADNKGKTTNIIWGRFVEDLFDPVVDVEMSAIMTNVSKSGVVADQGNGNGNANAVGIGLGIGLGVAFPALAPFVGGIVGFRDATTPGGIADFSLNPGGVAGGLGAVPPAPVAIGAGAFGDGSRFVASVMPSVGKTTEGLLSGRPGIAPPDRKRIAGLLTAMFRDPCLCVSTDVELRSVPGSPTNARNGGIVRATEAAVVPSPSDVNVPSTIIIAPTNGIRAIGNVIDLAPYDMWEAESTAVEETGAVQMPGTGVGSNGGTGIVVQAHGGLMAQTTAWVASRYGKPPQLPSFKFPGSGVALIKAVTVTGDTQPSPDGAGLIYRVAGYCVHAVTNPSAYQIQSPVGPMLDFNVRLGAAIAASFWTLNSTWANTGGFGAGLINAVNANPFGANYVNTALQPVVPPGFLASQAINAASFNAGDTQETAANTVFGTGGGTGDSGTPAPDNTSYNFPFDYSPTGVAGGILTGGVVSNADFYFPPNR